MKEELLEAREYEAWLSKFEAKKTTDDCYTPAAVYEAVKAWAVEEYKLNGRRVLRPFYPGGDYESVDYQDGDVVIDNPPFSILTKIVRFYEGKGVDFFLFAPTLTLFGSNAKCSIVAGVDIKYANGAVVNASFLTSLDDAKVRTAPRLKKAIEEAQENGKAEKPKRAKYVYPGSVITAALLKKISRVDFRVYPSQISDKTPQLDSQKEAKKTIFGCGFLISEKKAEELKAAEKEAAVGAIEWPLSAREMDLIKGLD